MNTELENQFVKEKKRLPITWASATAILILKHEI
jgi:hypothetical protein